MTLEKWYTIFKRLSKIIFGLILLTIFIVTVLFICQHVNPTGYNAYFQITVQPWDQILFNFRLLFKNAINILLGISACGYIVFYIIYFIKHRKEKIIFGKYTLLLLVFLLLLPILNQLSFFISTMLSDLYVVLVAVMRMLAK